MHKPLPPIIPGRPMQPKRLDRLASAAVGSRNLSEKINQAPECLVYTPQPAVSVGLDIRNGLRIS